MKKRRILLAVLGATILGPTNAHAFMDMPTLAATFPAMLLLLIPIILVETYAFPRLLKRSLRRVAQSSTIAGIVTLAGMFLFGRLHLAATVSIHGYTDILPYGISSLDFAYPSLADVIYHCTLGSALLVQRSGFFAINVLVIMVFLLPTAVIYYFTTIYALGRGVDDITRVSLRPLVLSAKLTEYALLVMISLLFARRYIYG